MEQFVVAVVLVIVTVVAADSPNQKPAVPYQPRGWRPNGPAFNPNLRLQQQQVPPAPSPSYGPPPSASYGPPTSDATTTEQPTTTEVEEVTTFEPQAENIQAASLNPKPKSDKLQKGFEAQPGPVYVLLPQGQALIYAAAPLTAKAAPLKDVRPTKKDVELVNQPKLAPVQAIPALAKIQAPVVLANVEQVPQLVKFQQIQAVPIAGYATSLSQSSVYTPYSSSYVQVFQ